MSDETILATQRAGDGLRVDITSSQHKWVGDEHASEDIQKPAGPDPFAQLLGSLASCMAITVRMYTDRKGWPLDEVRVEVSDDRKPAQPLERAFAKVTLVGDLDEEQRQRVFDISKRCPVHRTLAQSVSIQTTLEA